MNDTDIYGSDNHKKFVQWLLDIKWSPDLAKEWQEFYNTAELKTTSGIAGSRKPVLLFMPKYKDLPPVECKNTNVNNNAPLLTHINTLFIYLYVCFYYYCL